MQHIDERADDVQRPATASHQAATVLFASALVITLLAELLPEQAAAIGDRLTAIILGSIALTETLGVAIWRHIYLRSLARKGRSALLQQYFIANLLTFALLESGAVLGFIISYLFWFTQLGMIVSGVSIVLMIFCFPTQSKLEELLSSATKSTVDMQ